MPEPLLQIQRKHPPGTTIALLIAAWKLDKVSYQVQGPVRITSEFPRDSPFAKPDLERFGHSLSNCSIHVWKFLEGTAATVPAVKAAIKGIFDYAVAEGIDQVIVAYSGHQSKSGSWLLFDQPLQLDGRLFHRPGVLHTLVVNDCCYSSNIRAASSVRGDLLAGVAGSKGWPFPAPRPEPPSPDSSQTFLFSSLTDDVDISTFTGAHGAAGAAAVAVAGPHDLEASPFAASFNYSLQAAHNAVNYLYSRSGHKQYYEEPSVQLIGALLDVVEDQARSTLLFYLTELFAGGYIFSAHCVSTEAYLTIPHALTYLGELIPATCPLAPRLFDWQIDEPGLPTQLSQPKKGHLMMLDSRLTGRVYHKQISSPLLHAIAPESDDVKKVTMQRRFYPQPPNGFHRLPTVVSSSARRLIRATAALVHAGRSLTIINGRPGWGKSFLLRNLCWRSENSNIFVDWERKFVAIYLLSLRTMTSECILPVLCANMAAHLGLSAPVAPTPRKLAELARKLNVAPLIAIDEVEPSNAGLINEITSAMSDVPFTLVLASVDLLQKPQLDQFHGFTVFELVWTPEESEKYLHTELRFCAPPSDDIKGVAKCCNPRQIVLVAEAKKAQINIPLLALAEQSPTDLFASTLTPDQAQLFRSLDASDPSTLPDNAPFLAKLQDSGTLPPFASRDLAQKLDPRGESVNWWVGYPELVEHQRRVLERIEQKRSQEAIDFNTAFDIAAQDPQGAVVPPPTPQPKQPCPCCTSEILVSEMVSLRGCAHWICLTCLQFRLETSFKHTKATSCSCPTCQQRIDDGDIAEFADAETLDAYCQNVSQEAIVECPFCSKKAAVMNPDVAQQTCPYCLKTFCLLCKAPYTQCKHR